MTSRLFEPFTLRGTTFANRAWVSPMCQYSSVDGAANDWHVVHLGTRAVGGAGLVFTEASAVTAGGRISPQDLGVWNVLAVGSRHAQDLDAFTVENSRNRARTPKPTRRARTRRAAT